MLLNKKIFMRNIMGNIINGFVMMIIILFWNKFLMVRLIGIVKKIKHGKGNHLLVRIQSIKLLKSII